jgi:hypothetical protein
LIDYWVKFLGGETASQLKPLLKWVTEPGVGPGIASIIVIAGGLLLLFILITGIQDYLLISKARAILEKGTTQQTFSENYNTIDQKLLKLKKVKGAWLEFSETLILPSVSDEGVKHACSNTQRPHDFFNINDLHVGPHFTKSLPNIFIGVGLALTFLGLISALSFAVQGMANAQGDTASIQSSISGLLNAASAKFYASLFALFTSIMLTIAIKGISAFLSFQIRKLNESIENGVRYITLESLNIQTNVILSNQLVQLQTFNTDLAMKVGEQVQQSLEKTLSPLVEKMTEMGSDINQSNIENLRDITAEVTKGIQGAAGESMERVANTLDGVSEKLGGLTDILSGALTNFDAEFTTMLDGLKTSLENSTESVAEGVGKTMKGMNDGIQESASTVTGLVNGLAGTIESLSRTGEEVAARGGEALRVSVTAAAEAAGESITKAGQDLSDGFKASTVDLIESFSVITTRLNEMDNSLREMPESLGKINNELAISSNSITEASVQFRGASGGLQSLIEPISAYASDTREQMKGLTETLSDTSLEINAASNQMNQTVENLNTVISRQINELAGSDEQLAGLLTTIHDSTEKVLSSVTSYVTDVDKGFKDSLGVLDNTIITLEETLTAYTSQIQDDVNRRG